MAGFFVFFRLKGGNFGGNFTVPRLTGWFLAYFLAHFAPTEAENAPRGASSSLIGRVDGTVG